MKSIWIAAAMAAACAGSAWGASYMEPPASTPAAELVFSKGYASSIGAPGQQGYWFGASAGCVDQEEGAGFAAGSPPSKSRKVAAGGRLYVHGLTVYTYTRKIKVEGGMLWHAMGNRVCRSDVSFTPEAGHVYSVTHRSVLGEEACQFEILDQATSAPPPSVATEGTCPKP